MHGTRFKKKVKSLLHKARESAFLAINVYNNPSTVFRSSGYVVLMNVAWTSLFHAIFERDGIKYYYKDSQDRRRYVLIDGERKSWDLSKCSKEYFKDGDNPLYQNIQFFIGIRNKIEHSFAPQIDPYIFGESQSYLLNFEEILVKEFGESYALADSLIFALQFSRIRTNQQIGAIRSLQSRHLRDIMAYIDNFRRNLDSRILSDPSYAFRVFLIPKPANRLTSADAAIEFIKWDPTKPEEMKMYEHLVTIIKEKSTIASPPNTNVSLVKDPLEAKERVLLVDRGRTNIENVVGITDDPAKASGVLVIEKLSDEIFNDVPRILDAAMILNKRFGDFPLSERATYFVYASREKIDSVEIAELFLKSSYDHYWPFYYWLLKVDSNITKNFIKSALDERLYPKVLALFRLFLVIKKDNWLNYVIDIMDSIKDFTQKPQWYWNLHYMLENKRNSKIYIALDLKPKQTILDYTVEQLLADNELANQILSTACKEYAINGKYERSLIRKLDLIANLEKLSNMLPEP